MAETKTTTAKPAVKKSAAKPAVKKPAVKKVATKKTIVKKPVKKAPLARVTSKKQLVGIVMSTKGSKTAIVSVSSYKEHPLYGKRFQRSKRIAAHDETEMAKVGDKVQIIETRPISKTKRYRVSVVVEAAREAN